MGQSYRNCEHEGTIVGETERRSVNGLLRDSYKITLVFAVGEETQFFR